MKQNYFFLKVNSIKKSALIVLFLFVKLFLSAQTTGISLSELKQLYNDYYLASRVDSMGWKSKGNCNLGTLPNEIYIKAEKRINFFRLVSKLPPIKIVGDKQTEAQAAAFMMFKNRSLSHSPPKTWKCYSEAGYEGAKNSCLRVSSPSFFKETFFLTDFIMDYGEANYFVGHRRWILYSKAISFSYGATNSSEALYCNNYSFNDTVKPTFMAYPWSGCVPNNLMVDKWSFTIPSIYNADLSEAKVTVTDNKGKKSPVKLYPINSNFPDATITWKMSAFDLSSPNNQSENVYEKFVGQAFKVKVESIRIGKKLKNIEYTVKVVKL